eukprot:m.104168 g.104168  ORF g.104168 m.104168 type:complete len:398 (+) comp37201_c0_seq12:690-1883(+)
MLYKDAVMTALEIAKRRCGKTFDVSDNEGTETEETETEDTPVNVSAASASATQDNSPSATQDNPPSVSQDSSPSPEKTQITSPPPPVAKEPLPQTQTQKPKSKSKKTKRLKPIRLDDPVEQQLVDWALAGFPPTGPDGFQPSKNEVDGGSSGVAEAEAVVYKEKSVRESSPGQTVKGSGSKLKGAKDLGGSQMENELDKRASCVSKEERERFSDVRNGSRKIESLCLGCASLNPMAEHPLFDGGLCETCKECFEENCYLFDDDGTQMYCAICCDGREVFLCDVMGCSRAYCTFCIEKICGSEEVDKVDSALLEFLSGNVFVDRLPVTPSGVASCASRRSLRIRSSYEKTGRNECRSCSRRNNWNVIPSRSPSRCHLASGGEFAFSVCLTAYRRDTLR